MATYVNDLRLKEIATGDESGTWGTSTNTNLELIAEAFSFGTEAITTNADTHTTTIADGSTDPGRSIYLKYTGTLDSACTITIGPNTVSKLWFIENGTSGSQNIIISQGSGANVTIPPGDTKAIYSDGAGSGAAMVDAFASLNVVDLKVEDDLTVTDDLIVNGDIDLEGSIDVNGTANLDVVDIDGAVDMASTLAVTGIVTLTDDLIIGDGKTIGSASDVDAMTIASNGQVTFSQTLIGTALDISGDIDVDGTTNLDVVDIDGAVDMASTLAVGGAVTANAGVVIDNITIDGTEIDLSSGDLTLDSAGDIILDADGADIIFKDAGTAYCKFTNSSGSLHIVSQGADNDIKFFGNDGGSSVTALTLDMSDAGTAFFNNKVAIGNSSPTNQLHVTADSNVIAKFEASHTDGAARILFKPKDNNGWNIGGNDDGKFTIFDVVASTNSVVVETGAAANTLVVDSNSRIGIGTASPSVAFHTVGKVRAQKSGQTSAYVQLSADDVTSNYAADIFVNDTGLTFKHNSNGRGFVFDQNGTERMRIDSSGQVGIGKTPSSANLDIESTGNGIQISRSGFDTYAFEHSAGTGMAILNVTDSRKEMFFNGAGSVGIGTISPTGLLEISGGDGAGTLNIVSTANSSGSGNKIAFFAANRSDTNEEMAFIKPLLTSNSGGSGNVQTGQLTFGTAGSERFRIDSSGNFAINRTSQIGTNKLTLSYASGSSEKGMAINTSNAGSATHITFLTTAAVKGSISTDGSSVTYNTSSDARLKDVTGKARGLEVIGQLNPVAYNWKESGQADEGLIAQEIEELVPNAVNQDEDGYYQMDYSKLVVHLIKAVQEQQEQIESLTSEIANLKGG